MLLPDKKFIAAFDIDCQNTFTENCPEELPVKGGAAIVPELNAQAQFASLRVASRDAHTLQALWIASPEHPPCSPLPHRQDMDLYWPPHAIIGTRGFDFIDGLDPKAYSFQVFKGIEIDRHPYGACYHDFADTLSTGVIEFLQQRGITTVLCGGLATDYCVKFTALQLKKAGFDVILNLSACAGITSETVAASLQEMQEAGVKFVESVREFQ